MAAADVSVSTVEFKAADRGYHVFTDAAAEGAHSLIFISVMIFASYTARSCLVVICS